MTKARNLWYPDGSGVQPGGDCGGDLQAGDAHSVRYWHRRDRRLAVEVTFYAGHALTQRGGAIKKNSFVVWRETEFMICRDRTQPGDTEIWCDYRYEPVSREHHNLALIERVALAFAHRHTADQVTWDGRPFNPGARDEHGRLIR